MLIQKNMINYGDNYGKSHDQQWLQHVKEVHKFISH